MLCKKNHRRTAMPLIQATNWALSWGKDSLTMAFWGLISGKIVEALRAISRVESMMYLLTGSLPI